MKKKQCWNKYSSNRPYDDRYIKVRNKILKRDKYKCQYPNCVKKGLKLHCHHILRLVDSPHLKYTETNLITLCSYHHKIIVTNNEAFYIKLFTGIVNAKLRPK